MDGLLRLISRLTDLSRESKTKELFAVVPVIQKSIGEALASKLQPDHKLPEVIPLGIWGEAKLLGDPLMLGVVLRNIIINAVEASPRRSKIIVALDSEESGITISVQDEGSGMTEEQIEAAFKPFTSLKKDQGGLGLGIPIAQKIIRFDFEGDLIYKSEPGKGTRVDIVLPSRTEKS